MMRRLNNLVTMFLAGLIVGVGIPVAAQSIQRGGTTVSFLTALNAVTAYSATATPAGGTTGAGLKISSTANLGVFWGSGVPTLSAAKGSLYIRTDGSSTSTRLYVNTDGATTWTNFTSGA